MNNIIDSNVIASGYSKTQEQAIATNLSQAEINKEYIIKEVRTNDVEVKEFLFTLGCYEGEEITVISALSENYVINVKDARYSIDKELAEAIII